MARRNPKHKSNKPDTQEPMPKQGVPSRRGLDVLKAIDHLIESRGFCPTYEDIGSQVNISAIAGVHRHVQNLSRLNLVARPENSKRAIEITDAGQALLARVKREAVA